MKVAAGLSADPDPLQGAAMAAREVARDLDGAEPDLAMVFASGAHLTVPEATLETIHAELAPEVLVGCGAGGVLGAGRELESGTAMAIWAAALDAGSARPFHATVTGDGETGVLEGLPELGAESALIVLSDPYSFPTDGVLDGLAREAPGVPVLGGLSSARTPVGDAALFAGDTVRADGAVGVCLDGVEMIPCVSQGATPLGPEMTITAAEDNVIHELAGRPAVQAIENAIAELPLDERALVLAGLMIGIVIDGGKPEYEQGDFLVRGILGADPQTGAVSIGAAVAPGQVVRLHARDADSADVDLRRELRLRAAAIGGQRPAGALVFSCNGRGRSMFGTRDHDASMIEHVLGAPPAAGFFAAGEIGPVGGRSFLHGFTATIAVFPG
ncbi:MAG TPA: FIST N-terminal domain-containing protein [Solirubrobacteraceae bacterium]|jgi:small ligand-binding sensory domain FIST|nr:FIST N-terminal domain-containing protein [Solirubrobacteraceae bacterium]